MSGSNFSGICTATVCKEKRLPSRFLKCLKRNAKNDIVIYM